MGLRQPERVSPCAFTAVIANWVCALFAMIEMGLVTNLCIGAVIVVTGTVPGLARRCRCFRARAIGRPGSALESALADPPGDPALAGLADTGL